MRFPVTRSACITFGKTAGSSLVSQFWAMHCLAGILRLSLFCRQLRPQRVVVRIHEEGAGTTCRVIGAYGGRGVDMGCYMQCSLISIVHPPGGCSHAWCIRPFEEYHSVCASFTPNLSNSEHRKIHPCSFPRRNVRQPAVTSLSINFIQCPHTPSLHSPDTHT